MELDQLELRFANADCVSRRLSAMLGVALATAGCDGRDPRVSAVTSAIIECNSETVGDLCDTDDTVCTVEECEQIGADVVCVQIDTAPDSSPCESDGDPCTLDRCQSGLCQHDPLPVGATCSDGLFCTTGESCNTAGECKDGADACDDGDSCTANLCDEASNTCTNDPLPAGTPCDDGNPCTDNTTCDAGGVCGDGDAVVCDDANTCTGDMCVPFVGCEHPPLPATTPCDDVVFCTTGDRCDGAGGCFGRPTCDDANQCTDDLCDELGMTCTNTVIPDASCDDGNTCTSGDTCGLTGTCAGSPIDDGTPCTAAGGCEEAGTCTGGVCGMTTPAPDGTPCDDGNACTMDDLCLSSVCSGPTVLCEDGDACTTNSCDPATGCVFFPIPDCLPPDAGVPDAAPPPDAPRGGADAARPDAAGTSPDGGPGFVGELGGGGCTCQTAPPAASSWMAALIVLAWLMRRRRSRVAIAVAVAALAALAPAGAGADGFDSELYKPAPSSTGYFTLDRADVLGGGTFNFGLSFNLSTDVLLLRDPDTGQIVEDGRLVSSRLGLHLSGAVGLLGWLELGAELPVAATQSGSVERLRPGESLAGSALGDLRLSAKARALRSGPAQLAVVATATLPTGNPEAFVGGETATFAPKLVAGLNLGRVSVAINAGYRVRGAQGDIAMLRIDDEVFGGIGLAITAMPRQLWVLAEIATARGVQGADVAIERPAEAILGARYQVSGPWVVQAGVGSGLGRGYGTPSLRGVVTLQYAPLAPLPAPVVVALPPKIVKREPPPPEPKPPVDSDGDGYNDDEDDCPLKAEDFDQFEDEDGCPDTDNDGDGILDVDDQCPDEAEVVNGNEDEDGCPDEGLIVVVENRIVLEESVLFDTSRARVKRDGKKMLKAILRVWSQHPEWERVIVEGHADERGPAEYNQQLSERRAQKVRQQMIDFGVPPDKIEAIGYGNAHPRVEGRSKEALQKNRRVEFVIIEKSH